MGTHRYGPNVMLHPQFAARLRTERHHINANLANFISWRRLVDEMRRSGEIKADETVEALVLTDDGIQYYVKGGS